MSRLMFIWISRLSSPSTLKSASSTSRIFLISLSVSSSVCLVGAMPVCAQIRRAAAGPMPKRYGNARTMCLWRGGAAPGGRGLICFFFTLTLLVTGVLADDPNDALAADHLALVAHCLDAGSNLHCSAPFTCADT